MGCVETLYELAGRVGSELGAAAARARLSGNGLRRLMAEVCDAATRTYEETRDAMPRKAG